MSSPSLPPPGDRTAAAALLPPTEWDNDDAAAPIDCCKDSDTSRDGAPDAATPWGAESINDMDMDDDCDGPECNGVGDDDRGDRSSGDDGAAVAAARRSKQGSGDGKNTDYRQ